MKDSDVQRIWHMKQYCEQIAQAVARFGPAYDMFAADTDYRNAVSMCIMQIGELSGRLSEEFKDASRNHVTWTALKGMRNWFAHDYISMDTETIWEAATKDAPALLAFFNHIIEENPEAFQLP
jgi:uncharacterized protein with HEPN domain